jgi:chromosomal replication initiation ATPase DnaA
MAQASMQQTSLQTKLVSAGLRRQYRQTEERCGLIRALVAAVFGVSERDLRAASRGSAPVAFARQVAMYLGHVVFGLSLTRVGQGFGRDRTTARHACHLVEDYRDDPAIDRILALLERGCCAGSDLQHDDDHAVRS